MSDDILDCLRACYAAVKLGIECCVLSCLQLCYEQPYWQWQQNLPPVVPVPLHIIDVDECEADATSVVSPIMRF